MGMTMYGARVVGVKPAHVAQTSIQLESQRLVVEGRGARVAHLNAGVAVLSVETAEGRRGLPIQFTIQSFAKPTLGYAARKQGAAKKKRALESPNQD